jgi:hypothetical protein
MSTISGDPMQRLDEIRARGDRANAACAPAISIIQGMGPQKKPGCERGCSACAFRSRWRRSARDARRPRRR